eukprot:13343393-Alexandrium_andersonii.AAC.1
MDVSPARTRAGRVRPGSPARQGHPMYSTCSNRRAARVPHAAHEAATAARGAQAPAMSETMCTTTILHRTACLTASSTRP